MQNTNTMRRVAGVLYVIFFALELYLFKPLYMGYSLMAVPVFVNALLIAATGAAAVWMLAGKGLVNKTAGRAVAITTGLVIIKSLVMYELENELLTASLSELLPQLAGSNIWNYVLIIVRLMLLIVAAFFVLNACEEAARDEEMEEEDEEDTVLEEEKEIAEEEKEEKDRLDAIESGMDKTLPGNDR